MGMFENFEIFSLETWNDIYDSLHHALTLSVLIFSQNNVLLECNSLGIYI